MDRFKFIFKTKAKLVMFGKNLRGQVDFFLPFAFFWHVLDCIGAPIFPRGMGGRFVTLIREHPAIIGPFWYFMFSAGGAYPDFVASCRNLVPH